MATTFQTAIADLVGLAESFAGFAAATSACVVRDVQGRVRLVVKDLAPSVAQALSAKLENQLGRWFHGPVITSSAADAGERRLSEVVLARATDWPQGWPQKWADDLAVEHTIDTLRWRSYQRVLSKQAWLAGSQASEVWPMVNQTPVVAAFYSFKGGVGRTTTLGAVAWQLARSGKKVVCIDLDVEAPGLAGLFGVEGGPSVMDFLISHAATGTLPGDDPVQQVDVHGATIHVMNAGTLDDSYVEQLARLDYLGTTSATDSPVAKALDAILKRIRSRHRPDFILLDCRAGIHDLGGLSMTDLAHIDILVGRDTPQGREGLGLTLGMLAKRRKKEDQRVLIVQTFVPLPFAADVARATLERFRTAIYRYCERTLYADDNNDMPDEINTAAAHYPWPIGQLDELARCQTLSDISEATLSSKSFTDIVSRLLELAASEHTTIDDLQVGDDA